MVSALAVQVEARQEKKQGKDEQQQAESRRSSGLKVNLPSGAGAGDRHHRRPSLVLVIPIHGRHRRRRQDDARRPSSTTCSAPRSAKDKNDPGRPQGRQGRRARPRRQHHGAREASGPDPPRDRHQRRQLSPSRQLAIAAASDRQRHRRSSPSRSVDRDLAREAADLRRQVAARRRRRDRRTARPSRSPPRDSARACAARYSARRRIPAISIHHGAPVGARRRGPGTAGASPLAIGGGSRVTAMPSAAEIARELLRCDSALRPRRRRRGRQQHRRRDVQPHILAAEPAVHLEREPAHARRAAARAPPSARPYTIVAVKQRERPDHIRGPSRSLSRRICAISP